MSRNNESVKRNKEDKSLVYLLKSEDLSNLGGPMGTESTNINWTKIFGSIDWAKKYAKLYYDGPIKITWKKTEKGFSSNDLGYVMYHIDVKKLN